MVESNHFVITNHAVERFIERANRLNMRVPHEVMPFLMRLVRQARPDKTIKPVYRVVRMLNNDCKSADYLTAEGWRFVVVDDRDDDNKKVVVTVERCKKWQN